MTLAHLPLVAACLAGLTLAADDLEARLDKGEIVVTSEKSEGSALPTVTMVGVIEAAPEKVWAILEDCGNYAKTMPRISESKELSHEGDVRVCEVTAHLPFPLSDLHSVARVVHTVEPGAKWTRAWTLVKGDYKVNEGSWVLTPFKGKADRTLARYRIRVEPNVSLPRVLIERGQTSTLPDILKGLREQTASK